MNYQGEFFDYKDKILEEGEHLILEIFPEKVIKLNELINKYDLSLENHHRVDSDLNIPIPNVNENSYNYNVHNEKNDENSRILFPNGIVPCNIQIVEMFNIMKEKMFDFSNDLKNLRMWINLLIPKIEDGNNFGVSIQKKVLNEIREIDKYNSDAINHFGYYLEGRGRIIQNIAKFPQIEDYRKLIEDLDN
ncbi:proteasome activator complex subunit 3-like protein, partial [Dinothrombium tinctorium]